MGTILFPLGYMPRVPPFCKENSTFNSNQNWKFHNPSRPLHFEILDPPLFYPTPPGSAPMTPVTPIAATPSTTTCDPQVGEAGSRQTSLLIQELRVTSNQGELNTQSGEGQLPEDENHVFTFSSQAHDQAYC